MKKNEKILAKLAGREPELYCSHCEHWWYIEECFKCGKAKNKIINLIDFIHDQSDYECPKCRNRTINGNAVIKWADRYYRNITRQVIGLGNKK